ncbi:MAG: hypothetical protein JWN27_3165 [Candidatus Eremiobacteraeota bacterium]|nr:hypothetical protein [Candidatus Eremiobacteraeota bacterium]
MNGRLTAVLAAVLAVLAFAYPRPADARSHDHGQTKFFTDVYIAPNEVVDGDLNVVFGNADIAGVVHGDVNTLFGTCSLSGSAQVDGQEHCIQNDTMRALVPWGTSAIGDHQDYRLFGKLASSAVVVLVFLLFPLRMRLALARVERHPALSVAAGALGAIAIFPIAIVLAISIIGIPLIALEAAAIFLGLWIGQGAISLLVGRRLCELLMPASTPSPLVALIMGLVIVSAAEIIPIVGWVVTALVWLTGLGAAILSFIRSAQLDGAVQRAPIAGPPMRGWR